MFCNSCGSTGEPVNKYRGSVVVEAVLLILAVVMYIPNRTAAYFLFAVFLVAAVWRQLTKYPTCSACRSRDVIPESSPVAARAIAEREGVVDPAKPPMSPRRR